ncbi:glycoside hydrolase family 28 protein [Mangrovimonas sp. TPBH4]|uniref:glycoside hydrolase family 28 protein n=1 Tax=Mangrovimonas sp. TPBH4 TaxID=1645914 RepID=UPI0006B58EA9|nr:glycoside hydrolase family 28 protein [Mangrovimonas sp. TPBH4]
MNNILKAHLSKLSFIISVMFVFVTIVCFFSCAEKKGQNTESSLEDGPWAAMQKIVSEVKVPNFPESTFNVLDYGAVADGVLDNTWAFKKAIEDCSQKGGGKVVVPSGRYLTGPIHLEDNVNLHLESGAEILFSTNPKDYPLVHTSYEGIELINYSPLIYAYQKENIAITGEGTLNGQASNDNWWPWCKKDVYGWKEGMPSQRDSLNLPRLMEMGEAGVPVAERVFGEGHYLRPTFLEPFECSNVLIQGVKIVNAPFWVIHPIKSNNVTVDGVTVESHGPNNDGCDPEYSKNVIIKNCVFNTGDDCIAIKAGRDAEGRRVAIKSENIVVQNCKMIDGHGGVVIGSEMSAGVTNVYVENCSMDSPHLDRAIRIKTNSRRGGVVDGVYVRNVEVGQVKEAVLRVNLFYATYGNQTGEFIPTVKNISLENITVKDGGKFGILAKGYPDSPVQNITFKDVVIEQVDSVYSLENVENMKFINTHINGELITN